MREGVVVGLANHSVLIAKDGTEHPIADSGAPIRDKNGAVAGVVLVFRIRRERAAQRTLRESEERFRVIFEQSTIGNSLTLPTESSLKSTELSRICLAGQLMKCSTLILLRSRIRTTSRKAGNAFGLFWLMSVQPIGWRTISA